MWHGERWLTSTSQRALVSDSSWRPELPEVSTTTAAQEGLRVADGGDEHVTHEDAEQICPNDEKPQRPFSAGRTFRQKQAARRLRPVE